MSSPFDPASLPAELAGLGEFRRLYETSGRSVMMTVWRGLFPLPFAVGMIVTAELWLTPRTWKYYLLVALGAAMFLNGVRVIIQAIRRRRQKIALFQDGFALWRNDNLKVYPWEQVEEIDSSPQFFGFTIVCRTPEGKRDKIHFNTSTDPTQNLLDLWRDVEELWGMAKLPAVLKTIADGGEAEFVRKIWGKIVGTRFGVSRMGLTAKPRYGETKFISWFDVERVHVESMFLVVSEKTDPLPWQSEPLLDVPGFAALVAAAEQMQREYLERFDEVGVERIPAAIAAIDAGQDLAIGEFGISPRGLKIGSETHPWESIKYFERQCDHIAAIADPDPVRLEYGTLNLADRIVLYSAIVHARFKDEPEDDEKVEDDKDEVIEPEAK